MILSIGAGTYAAQEPGPEQLLLKDYRPHSIYRVPETKLSKARFAVIDMHAHDHGKTEQELAAWVRTMDAADWRLYGLDLPAERFDGVFANAALFHVPRQELPRVLRQLHATLKPGGVLFSSNPRGAGQEGWNGDRYGVFLDWETWKNCVTEAGFVELSHYYRPPGLPREQQPWLASVWRKPAA